MFGGGSISNKTSRLYQKLVEAELAVGIGGGVQATREPYVYSINATIRPDKTVEDVLRVIDEEIDKLTNDSIQMDEIRRAVKQAKAMFVYGSENITNQAFWMGYAEMFASYDWFLEYLDNLESVKPEDILNVARTYLHPDHRVIGKYIPDERAQSS